jgi:branched-chain amino acid aminotransferase
VLQTFDERNRNLIVNVAGELTHRDRARVSPFDSAVQGGDAVWEGLRLYRGRIFRLEQHLDRLVNSAKALAFAQIPSRAAITTEIRRTLAANQMFDGVHIRLTLTRGVKITSGMDPRLNQHGPTLIILAEHKPPVYSKSGLSLVTSSVRRFPPDCLDPKIHHNNLLQSILAKIEANVAGADDALMLDTRGLIAETNATHVFVVERGRVRTPRLVACPEGITRATVLELCTQHGIPYEEADLTLAQAYAADEVFCTGTMGEIAGVTMIDGRPIGAGHTGTLTARIARLYQQHARAHGTRLIDQPAVPDGR